MNTYLAIITTVLVLTQIIRITQNHISLFRQSKKIDEDLKWLKDKDVSERDFDVQREVFYLLRNKLKDPELCDCKNCGNKKEDGVCEYSGVCICRRFEDGTSSIPSHWKPSED